MDSVYTKKGNNNPKVFYGLQQEIRFCNNCTYNNQKPNSEALSLNIK